MSDFNIEIINPQNNTLEIENSLSDTITNLDIILIDNTTLEIVNTEKILPSDFPNTYPFTSIIGDVPYTRVSGLTENTQDIIGSSLSGISGINIFYNDSSGFTTISLSDPIINTVDIIDFNSAVSGLLPVKNISGSGYVIVSSTTGNYIVSVTGLQPSGSYSLSGHSHTSSNISDFNSSVDSRITIANLQPSGSYSLIGHDHSISNISGLQTALDNKQSSGNYALSSHNHTSSDITNFNSSVSGILPITSLSGSTGIGITQNGTVFTIATTGTFGLTQDQVDSRVNILTSGIYAPLNSPSFTGIPLVPTATSGTNNTQIASTAFVRTEISNLIASAPIALDTLNELATALGNDANFSTTITNNLASKANLSGATFTGSISGPSGNFTSLKVNNVDVSANGHTHTSSNITDFNSSVSGLIPVKNISNGGYLSVSSTTGNYTISVTGLQPSGNYSSVGHTHTSSNITDFNSSVSGLLSVKDILGGSNISITNSSGNYTVSVSGNLGLTTEEVDDRVASLLVGGSGTNLVYDDNANTLTINHLFSTDLNVYVKNTTGGPLTKGQVVYINGAQGDHPTISLAIASGEIGSSKTLGLLKQNLAINEFGYVVSEGTLNDINTNSASSAGDTMWLSPTVSGGIVYGLSNKPSAPYHMVFLGYVIVKNQNNGKVYVKVQNGYELEELHNVAISDVSNGQFLQYNSASGLWIPSSSGNFTSLNVNNTNVSVSGHSHAISDVASLQTTLDGKQALLTNPITGTGITSYISKWTSSSGLGNSLIFDNGTNIGIETTSPSAKLDVNGNVNIDGNLTFDSFTESVVAIGNSSTSQTISLTSGTVQTCTLTGNCTFTMPTTTAGKSFSIFLNTGSGSFTATFTGVRWSDSTPPTITSTASKVDLLSFISDGSFWYGSFSQNYG